MMFVRELILALASTLLLSGVVEGQAFMNERCINSTDCVPKNTACIADKCQCKDGFYLMGSLVCRSISNFQESCIYNEDCKKGLNLECSSFQGNEKYCSCKSSSVWNGTTCKKVSADALLRSPCETNADCAPNLKMFCRRPSVEQGACSCAKHWKWNGTACHCAGKIDPGDVCVIGISVEDSIMTSVATAIGITLVCCCCCCFAICKCHRKIKKKKKQAAERMVAMSALEEEEDGYRVQADGFQVQYQPVAASGDGNMPPPPVAGQPCVADPQAPPPAYSPYPPVGPQGYPSGGSPYPAAGPEGYPPGGSPYPAAGAPGYPSMPYPNDPAQQGPNVAPYPPQPVPYQDTSFASAPPPTM